MSFGSPPGNIRMRTILKENMANYILLERLRNVDFGKIMNCRVFKFAKENCKTIGKI